LLSLQIPGAAAGRVSGRGPRRQEGEAEARGAKEIHVARKHDRFSSEIADARRRSEDRYVTVVAKQGEKVVFTLTLTNVFISSFQVSGEGSPTETVTLDAESSEIAFAEAAP